MKQPLLLDTNVCIWFLNGVARSITITTMTEAYNEGRSAYVSPITALEVATLSRKRRFTSSLTPERWFDALMRVPGVALAAMPPELLIASQMLPGELPGDPADRIIAATAREYGYTVLTRDAALLDYAAQGYLAAIPC
jgi:PIN domain nuclease of toxin-antitoxin system